MRFVAEGKQSLDLHAPDNKLWSHTFSSTIFNTITLPICFGVLVHHGGYLFQLDASVVSRHLYWNLQRTIQVQCALKRLRAPLGGTFVLLTIKECLLIHRIELVPVHAERCPRHWDHELRHARTRLLWKKLALVDNRSNSIFPKVQDPGAKDSHRRRTVGVHEAGTPLSLYRRITSDMALPSNGKDVRHGDWRAIPSLDDHGFPDCRVFRLGGYMALLDAPRDALGPSL